MREPTNIQGLIVPKEKEYRKGKACRSGYELVRKIRPGRIEPATQRLGIRALLPELTRLAGNDLAAKKIRLGRDWNPQTRHSKTDTSERTKLAYANYYVENSPNFITFYFSPFNI